MSEEKFIYVTSVGWKSGNPHEIEIWFVEHNHAYFIVSGEGDKAHWVQNIRRNPLVGIRLGEHAWEGKGRIVTDDEQELMTLVREKMQAKYNWSDGLIVQLTPTL